MNQHDPASGNRQLTGEAAKISQIREMFDAITPRYDLLNRLLSARRDVVWRRRAAELLPERVERVLDVATGTGDLAIEICRRRDGVRIYGVDFVPHMLELGRQKVRSINRKQYISLTVGDAMNLPFADHSFDAATIAFGLRNIPDKLGALNKMARVVRKGGRVLVLELTFPHNLGLKRFFNWYLNRVIPAIGGLISGDCKAYRYLPESIQDFLHPDELKRLFQQAGMVEVKAHPLTLGIAWLHEGTVV
jgi:demethylmenaquinone methyltransferase/2-methoxy-6-polyprenyl-1,4-benzoquinol methylase